MVPLQVTLLLISQMPLFFLMVLRSVAMEAYSLIASVCLGVFGYQVVHKYLSMVRTTISYSPILI